MAQQNMDVDLSSDLKRKFQEADEAENYGSLSRRLRILNLNRSQHDGALNKLVNFLHLTLEQSRTERALPPLLFPEQMIENIAFAISYVSFHEPGGLNGCALYIELTTRDSRSVPLVTRLPLCDALVPTFEVHMTLCQVKANMFTRFLDKMRQQKIVIDTGFFLEKKKLY